MSAYTVTPRSAKAMIREIIQAGLVPFLQSSPGIGKSSIMRSLADEFNLKLIDHRLSTSAPEDISGLPQFKDGKASFAPFADLFPLRDTPIPAGKDGWMLFFDEFNSASKAVQAAAYKPILDRMVGQHKLHSNLVITAAGNLASDRAITNPISTAMQSRVIHLTMETNFNEWLEDVALKENYDSRIIAFLSQYPGKLMDFRPDHNNSTFCCPRTWEFLNKLIQGKSVEDSYTAMYAGTISSGVAVEFAQFTKIYSNMMTIKQILADPKNVAVPADNALRWAVTSMMLEHINENTLAPLAEYINRFSMDFRVLFFRAVIVRKPELRQHPAFISAMSSLMEYLR